MAEYFTARGLPVPRELERNPLTDWRRLSVIAGAILVFYVGLRITNPDFSRANPEYAASVIAQLFHWDLRILTPQNEFETFWDTAEGLMIATIFRGTAAGVVGLAFHNVGVLGKLYSEAIEGTDAGPLEAITATGASRFQVIWTAVLPQIINPYISFMIYRLDANVRLAPILGYVGGGGIGVL